MMEKQYEEEEEQSLEMRYPKESTMR